MAQIKYNGKTLAEITTGQSITLHTDGHELEGDLVIEGFNGGGSCSGDHIIEVTELPDVPINGAVYKMREASLTDVLSSVGSTSNIISMLLLWEALLGAAPTIYNVNKLEDVVNPQPIPFSIYFVRSERMVYHCEIADDGTVSWTSLPETETDDSIVRYTLRYDYAGYEYLSGSFSDLILVSNGTKQLFSELADANGMTYSFNTIPTETTENIKVSDQSTPAYHWYYIEDANDVFVYGDVEGTGTNAWHSYGSIANVTFNGVIVDATEASVDGYYALGGTGWKRYFIPNGKITIMENSTVDVTNFSTAVIKLPEYGGTVVYE